MDEERVNRIASRVRVAWTDIRMQVSGRGDLSKAKKIVRKHLGKEVADSARLVAGFTYSSFRTDKAAVEKTIEELRRAGFGNAYTQSAM